MVQNQKRRQEGIMGKIDKDQLELFPDLGEVKVSLVERTRIRQPKFGNMSNIFVDRSSEIAHPLFERAKGYFLDERNKAYWAGMMDGDISIFSRTNNKDLFQVSLELANDAAEPVFELAELFDLGISQIDRKKKNQVPTLKTTLSSVKAIIFCFNIYEYIHCTERRNRFRTFLKNSGFGDDILDRPVKPMTWDYIAGLFDSEGNAEMELRQKGKYRSYTLACKITNSDESILKPLKQFFKDNNYELGSENARKGPMSYKKYHSTPELKKKWDDSHLKTVRDIRIKPGKFSQNLYRVYEELMPKIKIKHKIQSMKDTQQYIEMDVAIRGKNGKMFHMSN